MTDTHALKAKLAHRNGEVIAEQRLTQAQAAKRMGLSQPDVSRLLAGQLQLVSLDRLVRSLMRLDETVTIESAPRKRAPGPPADDPQQHVGSVN